MQLSIDVSDLVYFFCVYFKQKVIE